MNIHLIRTEDFPEAQYHEVLQFLQGQVGMLQFIEGGTVTLNSNDEYRIFEEDDFGWQNEVKFHVLEKRSKQKIKIICFSMSDF